MGTTPVNSVSGSKGSLASFRSLLWAAAAPKTFCSGNKKVEWSDIGENADSSWSLCKQRGVFLYAFRVDPPSNWFVEQDEEEQWGEEVEQWLRGHGKRQRCVDF